MITIECQIYPMPTRIGLIAGRHDLKANDGEPITDFIFGKIDDVHDFKRMENTAFEYLIKAKATELELYVTGLTPATTSTIKGLRVAIQKYGGLKTLTLMHYDRDKNSYNAQDYNWLCE